MHHKAHVGCTNVTNQTENRVRLCTLPETFALLKVLGAASKAEKIMSQIKINVNNAKYNAPNIDATVMFIEFNRLPSSA